MTDAERLETIRDMIAEYRENRYTFDADDFIALIDNIDSMAEPSPDPDDAP